MVNLPLLDGIRLVILPDHIDGLSCAIYDHLRCEYSNNIRYLNIILAPLFAFSDRTLRPMETTYDERDSFVYFNKNFLPPGFHAYDIYQEPTYEYILRLISEGEEISEAESRQNRVNLLIYSGKGHFAVDAPISDEIKIIKQYFDDRGGSHKLITRTWPNSKVDYIQLMLDSAGLILLDPFTNVIRDALMLGLPVFAPINGIDYDTYGVTRSALSFIDLLNQRNQIKKRAWDRHFSLARFNIVKQSIFFETVRKMTLNHSVDSGRIAVPFSPSLVEASIAFVLELQAKCVVVGSLSTATHAINSASDAFEIILNSQNSSTAIEYRQVANHYFSSEQIQ